MRILAISIFTIGILGGAVCLPSASAVTTTFSELEAVDQDGNSSFEGGPIEMTGIVINNPYDMLSGADEWQVFIQSVNPNDIGGAALYMVRAFTYSNPPQIYSNEVWGSEIERLMVDSGTDGQSLAYGDLVTVTSDVAGMFYKGKFNINEQHMTDSAYDFDITVLSRGGTPVATPLSLSQVKSADNTQFLFDSTRATGAEHYQGTLVHLDNLFLDPASVSLWNNNATVVVKQGDLSMDLKLGLDENLSPESMDVASLTSNPFSITAIFDQDSYNAKSGYRLWLTNASQMTVPEPGSCCLLLLAALSALLVRRKLT